jgi:hypothetical protein
MYSISTRIQVAVTVVTVVGYCSGLLGLVPKTAPTALSEPACRQLWRVS